MTLSLVRRLAYGVGHVLNDLCASMWFTYLLVYYHYVLQFSNKMAGYLLLVGQIADALSTPFVGYESDNMNGCFGYGKRKSWHLLGTLCVAISFPFIFNHCPTCTACDPESSCWAQFAYYAPFIVIFQFGWASTQVSHLSLIPTLTSVESEQITLNSFRYAFTVISNLTVFFVAWMLLGWTDVGTDKNTSLDPADDTVFTILSGTVVGIGILTSLFFHLGTKEGISSQSNTNVDEEEDILAPVVFKPTQRRIKDWFKDYRFYTNGVIYMCTRLVVNVSQIYIPLYVTDSLNLHKSFIAVVPLVMYFSGFVITFFMKSLSGVIGKQPTYCLGAFAVVGSCAWMWFLSGPGVAVKALVAAGLLGMGSSTMLVMSLSMTSSLIGPHTNTGAFVYGAMSFTDKLSNGLAVVLIQNFHPCKTAACCPKCAPYYRHIVSAVPGGVALLAVLVIIILALISSRKLFRSESGERQALLQKNNDSKLEDDCCLLCIRFGLFSQADQNKHNHIKNSVQQT